MQPTPPSYHRSLISVRTDYSDPTCSTVEEGAEQLDFCLQLSQPEVNRLVVEDGLLEDLPLPRVLDGFLNNGVHHGQHWG